MALVRTVRHFWPDLTDQLNALPDTRYDPFIEYDKKFLVWWGLLLFAFKLGSRRQLDYELRDADTQMLDNLNRLAHCHQESLPVHKTLAHFLGHVGAAPFAEIRTTCVRRLMRMKALDHTRLLGQFVIVIDGTGFLVFHRRHCRRCLTQQHEHGTVYLHPVLEAKLVDTSGLALSVGSEFIENPAPTSRETPTLQDYEAIKQDCELKAFARLAPQLKVAFPQTRLCISGDSILACGPVFTICEQYHWGYVLTFKSGRTPDLWANFEGLLTLVPDNSLRRRLPDGTSQHYRWVNDLDYIDSEKRVHHFDAIRCTETAEGKTTTFAWITHHHVTERNVIRIAEKGGRDRSKIENEGFNIQKNSGLNLEHAYSFHPEQMKAFYFLLQIAHLFLQLLEKGSLLRHLAQQFGATPLGCFGSLKNIARRLLDGFRYFSLPDEAFDHLLAARIQIRLADTS